MLSSRAAGRLDLVAVAEAVEHDVHADLGEAAGDAQADAAGRAGDDGVLPANSFVMDFGQISLMATDCAIVSVSICGASSRCSIFVDMTRSFHERSSVQAVNCGP